MTEIKLWGVTEEKPGFEVSRQLEVDSASSPVRWGISGFWTRRALARLWAGLRNYLVIWEVSKEAGTAQQRENPQ